MIATHAAPHVIQHELREARARLISLGSDLTGAQLIGPRLGIVNPPLWEIGHIGWFQERWCLRYAGEGEPLRASMLAHADALYDSSNVPHDTRWDLPLPDLDSTFQYLQRVQDAVLERLQTRATDTLRYFAEHCAMHEEMHCEALSYTRQTLGYRAPQKGHASGGASASGAEGDSDMNGGTFMLGGVNDGRFVFDNEKWAHPREVAPYAIGRACVTNADFAAFVDDRGYERRDLWSDSGWQWRIAEAAMHPAYWRKDAGAWHARSYDEWRPIEPRAAVMHVNWYEADAYCRWAGRRLPSEVEWELAAGGPEKRIFPWGDEAPDPGRANLFGVSDGPYDVGAFPRGDSAAGCRQMIGNVWEWCADSFEPYPGFVADPYKDYSEPWFGTHRTLRGGSFATRAALIRNTWRNFYTPDRRDVYAGFRTCRDRA
jgi:iron(II)-dependent oxidoreductase